MKIRIIRNAAGLLVLAALANPVGVWAQDSNPQASSTQPAQAQVPQPQQSGDVNWQGVGYGAGTVAGNLLYIPAKLVYGILGGVAGGASYLLTGGNTQVSNTIWRSSLGGDYVLTPDMIKGQAPVHFSGPTDTAPAPSDTSGSSSADPSNNSALASGAATGTSPSAASTATHPLDPGAGPIRSYGSPGSSSGAGARTSAPTALPDTSIE